MKFKPGRRHRGVPALQTGVPVEVFNGAAMLIITRLENAVNNQVLVARLATTDIIHDQI